MYKQYLQKLLNLDKSSEEKIDLIKEQYGHRNPLHGWISPEGQYHHMENDKNHVDWIYENTKHNEPGYIMGNAHKKGWISIGHAGENNAKIDRDILKNPNHPAMKKLRNLVNEHWDRMNINGESVDTEHFIKHGKIRPHMEEPIEKNENIDLVKEQWGKESNPNPVHGWISPSGNYHHMNPDQVHHRWISDYKLMSPLQAHIKGWISVGHTGKNNAFMHEDIAKQPNHPAMKKLRELAGKHWHDKMTIGQYSPKQAGAIEEQVDINHFIKHGKIRPHMEEPIEKNEENDPPEVNKKKTDTKKPRYSLLHGHHTLPIGASIEHLNWHLKNLDEGWKTIIEMKPEVHRKYHEAIGRGRMSTSGTKRRKPQYKIAEQLRHYHDLKSFYENLYDKPEQGNSVLNRLPHYILSAEAPRFPQKNKMTHEQVLDLLNTKGYKAESINGVYGGKPERSILIHNPPKKAIRHFHNLARDLGQESAIYSDGYNHELHFLNGENKGQHVKGQGTEWHKKQPEDNYSTLNNGQHFTHNFNFDQMHPHEKSMIKTKKLMQKSETDLIKKQLNFNTPNPIHGWISPEGKYHHINEDTVHSDWIGKKLGKNWNKAHEKGWISVGHMGHNNAGVDEDIKNNPNHPAIKSLRNLVGKNWQDLEINGNRIDVDHFVKHGKIRPHMEEPIEKNEDLVKHDFGALDNKGYKATYHGYIDSEGKYTKLHPSAHHSTAIGNHFAWKNPHFEGDHYKNAMRKGYVAVGHGGGDEISVHEDTLKNHEHPAHKALKKLMGDYGGTVFLHIHKDGKPIESKYIDPNHFHKFGTIKEHQFTHEPIEKSEPTFLPQYQPEEHPLSNPSPETKLIHYSPQAGLKVIDPNFHGERGIGSETKQGAPENKMSFFYLEGVKPESLVMTGAKHKYISKLGDKKLYDIGKDSENIYNKVKQLSMDKQVNPGVVDREDYHKAIRDAGYHGIYNSSLNPTMSHAVGIFDPMPVEDSHPIHPADHNKTTAFNHHIHQQLNQEARKDSKQTERPNDWQFLRSLKAMISKLRNK